VEAGADYDQLWGIMIEARTELQRDADRVAALGSELAQRYGGGSLVPGALEAIRVQGAKRVALRFVAQRTATWDHRKLASTY
jgi:hypothetical protein